MWSYALAFALVALWQMEDNVVKVVKVDDCGWCTMCELVCPTGAISCPFEIVIEDDSK